MIVEKRATSSGKAAVKLPEEDVIPEDFVG